MRAHTSAPISAVILASAVALGLATATTAQAQHAPSTLSRQDRHFAETAMADGLLEVQLGRLAQHNASAQPVRAFGGRMIQDHTKNNQQLKTVGQQIGLTPPTALPARQQHDYDRLAALRGAQFDNAYMSTMIQDHQSDIREFNQQIRQGRNAQLKQYASQTLPMLQQHLALAEDIARPQGAQLPNR